MDKKLPQSELPKAKHTLYIVVNRSYLPGQKCYKGNVIPQPTLNMDDIAQRVVSKRSEYRKETLINVYNLLKEEIYRAIEEGHNVDFGFGRTELTMQGSFSHDEERYDPSRHTLTARLRSSPQLRQRVASLKVINDTNRKRRLQPTLNYISLSNQPRDPLARTPINQLPAGEYHHLFIYGDRLKIEGDHPEVGLWLGNPDYEERFYTARDMIINSNGMLCFVPEVPLTPGEWFITICTQYSPTSRNYKEPRDGELFFWVV